METAMDRSLARVARAGRSLISSGNYRFFVLRVGAVLRACAVGALAIHLGEGQSHAQEATCASVRVQLGQSQTFERQAFDARLRIRNAFDTLAMDEVHILVTFTDAAGEPVLASSDPDHPDARFFLRIALDAVAVRSSPRLTLDCVLPAEIRADIPATEAVVGRAIPFFVGVRDRKLRMSA